MDLGMMMPVIFVIASFWATSISYAPFVDDFGDMFPTSLMEREDAVAVLCLGLVDGADKIGNQLLNLCLTLKSMIRSITIHEDCLLI